MGTTAALAAATGRPHPDASSPQLPLTSTAMMMGGFRAISHARVRSIDLATDMLLGGGRAGAGAREAAPRTEQHRLSTYQPH